MTDMANDFFEDDEPVEKIRAAFERGEKRVTVRATSRGITAFLAIPGHPAPAPSSSSGTQSERELAIH